MASTEDFQFTGTYRLQDGGHRVAVFRGPHGEQVFSKESLKDRLTSRRVAGLDSEESRRALANWPRE